MAERAKLQCYGGARVEVLLTVTSEMSSRWPTFGVARALWCQIPESMCTHERLREGEQKPIWSGKSGVAMVVPHAGKVYIMVMLPNNVYGLRSLVLHPNTYFFCIACRLTCQNWPRIIPQRSC